MTAGEVVVEDVEWDELLYPVQKLQDVNPQHEYKRLTRTQFVTLRLLKDCAASPVDVALITSRTLKAVARTIQQLRAFGYSMPTHVFSLSGMRRHATSLARALEVDDDLEVFL